MELCSLCASCSSYYFLTPTMPLLWWCACGRAAGAATCLWAHLAAWATASGLWSIAAPSKLGPEPYMQLDKACWWSTNWGTVSVWHVGPWSKKGCHTASGRCGLTVGDRLAFLWETNIGKIRCRSWKPMQQVVGMLGQKWRRFGTGCRC